VHSSPTTNRPRTFEWDASRTRPGRPSTMLTAATSALLAIGVLLGLAAPTVAADAGPRIDLVPVAEGFEQPVFVTAAPGEPEQLYVVEQVGRVRVMDTAGNKSDELFLDITAAVETGGERGLLGLAFHPAYADNGRFFVNYTRAGSGATVISEFSAVDGQADPASERELLVIEQPFANHNGGMIAFDAAGMLLIGMGDGGSGGDPLGAGQDPDTLLGKLLRIDVDSGDPYGIPEDNGFVDSDAHRPEIHAMGLRNPWRFSVDPVGGHVYIGDVGQGSWEEVSLLPDGAGGRNFGWNEVEGPACYQDGCDLDAYTPPVLSYDHGQGCSVTGGYAYRGTAQPGLEGLYLYGDYCSGTIWAASTADMLAGSATAVPVFDLDGSLVSFGLDAAGELYAVDRGGRILRVVSGEG
jgi:glucose/arabinose dehydrogenase